MNLLIPLGEHTQTRYKEVVAIYEDPNTFQGILLLGIHNEYSIPEWAIIALDQSYFLFQETLDPS